jgi:hypothetical protein
VILQKGGVGCVSYTVEPEEPEIEKNGDTTTGRICDDEIKGSNNRDIIRALAGDDDITARDDDVVYENDGDDLIHDNDGDDVLQGGEGGDRIFGDVLSPSTFTRTLSGKSIWTMMSLLLIS